MKENDVVLRKSILCDLKIHRADFFTEADYQTAYDIVSHTISKSELERRAEERKQFYKEHPEEVERLRKLGNVLRKEPCKPCEPTQSACKDCKFAK